MRAIKRYKTENFWEIIKGRYLKPETKNYVPKIMASSDHWKNLKSFGFENVSFQKTLDFEVITVAEESDLFKVAEAIGATYEEIHKWNPELMRWMTPPGMGAYELRLPPGYKKKWEECCSNNRLSEYVAEDFQIYRIKGKKKHLK